MVIVVWIDFRCPVTDHILCTDYNISKKKTAKGKELVIHSTQINSMKQHIVTSETAENQADQGNNTIAETVEHGDDSPHRLGTLSAQQLHKRSQLHPMGLLRSPGVISEHSKVPKTSEVRIVS